jgi:hypothetical protein
MIPRRRFERGQMDRISKGWDSMIERAHEGTPKYERVARELARLDRLTAFTILLSIGVGICTACAWVVAAAKEKIMTIMQNAPGDPTVTRIDNMDFGATEPDNTSLYQPKSEYATSNMPRFTLPPNVYGPVRNLAVVVMTESVNSVDRDRCLDQQEGGD